MLWNGETWTCAHDGFVNAILRKRCRNCGRDINECELSGDGAIGAPVLLEVVEEKVNG